MVLAGGIIYASDINKALTPPICKVAAQTTQNLSSGVDTAIAFGTSSTIVDSNGMHNESTNNTRLTVPVGFDGWWELEGVLFMGGAGSSISYTQLQISFYQNAGVQIARNRSGFGPNLTNVTATASGSITLAAAAGDYFEFYGNQIASTPATKATNAGGSFTSTFSAKFLRPL